MDSLTPQPSAQEGPETPGAPSHEPEAPADAANGLETPAKESKAPTPAQEPEAPTQEPKAPTPAQEPEAPADDDDVYPSPLPASSDAAQEPAAPAGGLRERQRVLAKKFAVFVNPRLLQFNRPFTLAFVIVLLSVVFFGVYFNYLLRQCSRQSLTTTTRSELNEWFNEKDSFDPMNRWRNWNCLYYTAKLMASDGDLYPEMASSFYNDYDDHCATTGKCEERYEYKRTPGNVRYVKCDVGTVRYTKKSRRQFDSWLSDYYRRWSDAYNSIDGQDEQVRLERGLASHLRDMLTPEDGAVPVNLYAKTPVWVAAHDVHLVPGAFDEISETLQRINADNRDDYPDGLVSKDHPVWLYLQSKPYKKFDGVTVESENMHKFEDLGGMQIQLSEAEVDALLESPAIRLRSKSGGQFPGICGEEYDYGGWQYRKYQSYVWYGTDRRRSSSGELGHANCNYGPTWARNLSQSVLGFEFLLQRKETVETAYDEKRMFNMLPERWEYIRESRLLRRDMFCDPADYDEFILYQDTPNGRCTEDKLDEPECTLVRKCDLTGLSSDTQISPGWANSEPSLQPEHGSFLVVYQVCPKLLETAGVALGFIGQIELFITFLTMGCCLGCGCVRVRGEVVQTGGCVQQVMRRMQIAVDTATEAEERKDFNTPERPGATE